MEVSRLLPAALVAATLSLTACSGGGEDAAPRSTTLSVSLMDAPVDGLTEVNVEIAAMWIKPTNGPAVQLPLTKTPFKTDLLKLTEGKAAVLIDEAVVQPGSYEWLAMDVNAEFDNVYDSYVKTSLGGDEELRVPSSRVRLVSGFEVPENQAVRLLFDWDLRMGMVDPPGQAGYLLKPAFRMLGVREYGALQGTIALTELQKSANNCNADTTTPDLDVGNVVYVFAGTGVTPDDVDGIPEDPIATARATQQIDGGDYSYRLLLSPGDYTVAFTCQAGNDNPLVDETPSPKKIVFLPAVNAAVTGGVLTVNFSTPP